MAYGVLFYAVAFLVLASAAVVTFSRNIMRSAFSLLVCFLGVALVYAMLGADFLAVTQLLLYVGGILVLILFAVMLTNEIGKVAKSNNSRSVPLAIILAGVCFLILSIIAVRAPWKTGPAVLPQPMTRDLGYALLGPYLLPFEVASLVLLVGMIGAVAIARKETRETAAREDL